MASLGEAFLGEGNVAGKNMLKLCARGSAIISELLRLSENIPSAFLMQNAHYSQVLLDYQFFKNEAHYDSRISADQALIELDDEVKGRQQRDHGRGLERVLTIVFVLQVK